MRQNADVSRADGHAERHVREVVPGSSHLSSYPRQTLNVRQAETVEKLFDATGALLDEVGHEQLTIRTVASRAGVSPVTAYNYFSSKDHLFAGLF
jgi:AcrR family transcriptional regulator